MAQKGGSKGAGWFLTGLGSVLLFLAITYALDGESDAAVGTLFFSLFFLIPGILELLNAGAKTLSVSPNKPAASQKSETETGGRKMSGPGAFAWLALGAGIFFAILFFAFYNQQSDLLSQQRTELDALKQQQQEQATKQESEKTATQKYVQSLEKKIAQQTPLPPTETSVEAAVTQWKTRVAFIYCEWRYSDTNVLYQAGSGSGTLERIEFTDGTVKDVVLTNKHVLKDSTGLYSPSKCLVSFPGFTSVFIVQTSDTWIWTNFDGGYIDLTPQEDAYVKKAALGNISCTGDPVIGEKVVILGYPGIGSQAGEVTATQGIISGHDDPYWITDAKLEHGNSGGLAVSLKRNCALGIPTAAVSGTVESLGRILDMHQILK